MAARTASCVMPGIERMSTVNSAWSGTELMFSPPAIVPTFSVGLPITACGAMPKSKLSSFSTLRAAL